jgi:hexosaminidase
MNYGLNPRASTAYNVAGQYGGYYTASDVAEVVAYAQQRHITVVPEIELPCHCQAALLSYPAFGCGNPASSYKPDNIQWGVDLFSLGLTNYASGYASSWPFFTNVLNTVMSLFPSQYIHCGGDEVVNSTDKQWASYTNDVAQMKALGINYTSGNSYGRVDYQHWFSTNLANYIQSKGRTMVGWGEFDAGGIVPNALLMDWDGGNSYAVQAAQAGQSVVMALDNYCYLNYCETGSGSTIPTTEPFFMVGGAPSFLSVQTVYSFEPVPSGLTGPATNKILGAQCGLWGENVPSPENVEFKLFPRLCAMAELTWTAATNKNYADFSTRLVTQEQRLAQMGLNYNHEAVTPIGTWGPTVTASPSYSTTTYTITPYVNQAGEIDINFYYTGGANGNALYINSVALLENGVQVDIDNGYLGTSSVFPTYISFPQVTSYNTPYFVLRLPWYHPGSTYTIQASIAGFGGTASSGTVYLVNWN